jgi:hypothetical protein
VASKQLFLEMLKSSKIFVSQRNFFVKENENLLECSEIFVLPNGTFKIYLFSKHVSKPPRYYGIRYYGIYEKVSLHPSPQRFAHQIGAFYCCLRLAIGHSFPETD